MDDFKNYREAMGARLRKFRQSRNLTAYRIAKRGGLSVSQVRIVEDGLKNYTIDLFLSYIKGCDLYMFFGEKSPGNTDLHEVDDLIKKALENDPQKP